jgi:glycosyltransferase involved in cell wall biosynthesis
MEIKFSGRLGLQQRVLPAYRAAFFNALGKACGGGLSVFAGQPQPDEGIDPIDSLQYAQLTPARNRYVSNPGSSTFLCWQSGLTAWLNSWQPEALVVEANPRYLSSRLAIRWMHRQGRLVIGWGLGAPRITGPLLALRQWERTNFLSSLDVLIAYSQQGAQQYRQLGFDPKRIYVAFNAVDPAPSVSLTQRAQGFTAQPTILFVGRLQRRKRVDMLIQACAELSLQHQPRLLIVGDGPARSELEQLAAQIYPKTKFVGVKQGAELDPYFNEADLFVLPGTGGLAIQQAMAHGLPIVAAQGDGTQADLVREDNGWIIPEDDDQYLRNTLTQALSDPIRLRTMGEASYRIVSEEINIDKMVEVFIKALNDHREPR